MLIIGQSRIYLYTPRYVLLIFMETLYNLLSSANKEANFYAKIYCFSCYIIERLHRESFVEYCNLTINQYCCSALKKKNFVQIENFNCN